MSDEKSQGRKDNGATPGGKPDAAASDREIKQTGQRERRSAGPDGPDATEVGDTFKRPPN